MEINDAVAGGLDKLLHYWLQYKIPNGEQNSPYYGFFDFRPTRSFLINAVNGNLVTPTDSSISEKNRLKIHYRCGSDDLSIASGTTFQLPSTSPSLDGFLRTTHGSIDEFIKQISPQVMGAAGAVAGMHETERAKLRFQKMAPVIYADPLSNFSVDPEEYAELAKHVTRYLLEANPMIIESNCVMQVGQEQRLFLNTEGSRIITAESHGFYQIAVSWYEDGDWFTSTRSFRSTDYAKLKDMGHAKRLCDELLDDVANLAKREVEPSSIMPIVLGSKGLSTIIHEAVVAHLLSALFIMSGESTTFAGYIGKQICPDYITITNDPTLGYYTGDDLLLPASYRFDDEGVPAQKLIMVEDGVLKSYLHSRETAAYFGVAPTGNARCQFLNQEMREAMGLTERPTPRMSIMDVSVTDGLNMSKEELFALAQQYAQAQGKEYVLYCDGVCGQVQIENSQFSFIPEIAERIYPDGRRVRVDDLELISDSHAILNLIRGCTKEKGIDYGSCGGETGWVPVANLSPQYSLIEAMSVNRLDSPKKSGQLLPFPTDLPLK